jgi:glutathione S-transferase
MDWVATDLFSGLRPVFIGMHVKTPEFAGKPGAIEWGLWQWTRQMQLLEAELAESGKAYLAGKTFTLADIPAGLVVNRWFGLDFEKPELPAVARYYERLSERPAYLAHGRNGTP